MSGRSAALLASLGVALVALSGLPGTVANHPQTGSGKAVAFDHKTGNEWWVEVVLSGQDAGSAAKVEAMGDGGPWVALAHRPEWGAGTWAGSFRIEPGHRVQFRASWSGGAQQASCWFTHPAGAEQCAGAFDATWSGVRGNEWWVEAVIKANAPIDAVLLTIDCSTSRDPEDMVYRADWGKWVLGGVHIPAGSRVTMTAIGAGDSDDSGGYTWPQATPASGCQAPAPAFTAAFTNVKGNEWWVEAKVTASGPLSGVDARVGCTGPWKPLALRSWGNWAASFHVPRGSLVDFRATSASGATDLSDSAYVWPAATPAEPCAPAWPRAGSHADVRFRNEDRWADVDGEHYRKADGLVHAEWTGTEWQGTCEMLVTTRSPAGTWTNRTEGYEWDLAPPKGTVPATVGGTALLEVIGNCAKSGVPDVPVVGRETRAFSIRTSSGDPVPIDAYHGQRSDSGFHEDYWWDARHGLMLSWDVDVFGSQNSSHNDGWLLDTDAQFAP
jgi:hypothetical protein